MPDLNYTIDNSFTLEVILISDILKLHQSRVPKIKCFQESDLAPIWIRRSCRPHVIGTSLSVHLPLSGESNAAKNKSIALV